MKEEILGALLGMAFVVFLTPLVVMVCWNAVIPAVFGVIALTYKQSFCLCILVQFLFNPNLINANKK